MTQDRQAHPSPPSAARERRRNSPHVQRHDDDAPACSTQAPRIGARAKASCASSTHADPSSDGAERTADLCRTWLAQHAEACRLMLHWGQVEARLDADHGWYRLTKAQRERLPQGKVLGEIDAALDRLTVERDTLLLALPALPARTPETLALKLAVAAELVDVADFPEAHALIARIREDVLAL